MPYCNVPVETPSATIVVTEFVYIPMQKPSHSDPGELESVYIETGYIVEKVRGYRGNFDTVCIDHFDIVRDALIDWHNDEEYEAVAARQYEPCAQEV